jgi:hypothetical protein
MPKGTATATYFSNAAALSSFSFDVTGGRAVCAATLKTRIRTS